MKFRCHTVFHRCTCFHLYILQRNDILRVSWKRKTNILFFSKLFFSWLFIDLYHSNIKKKKKVRNHTWYTWTVSLIYYSEWTKTLFQNSFSTANQQDHAASKNRCFGAQTRQAAQPHAKQTKSSSAVLRWATKSAQRSAFHDCISSAPQLHMRARMQAGETERTTLCPSPKPARLWPCNRGRVFTSQLPGHPHLCNTKVKAD